jgi:uncharacterized delta-60 repeat protein
LYSQVDTAWVRRYNGPANNQTDEAKAIAVDNAGNVYVTGYCASDTYADFGTIKYNAAGVQQWVTRYNYYSDVAEAIAVDGAGNVYVTGWSGSSPNYDYATIKYNSAGVQQWVQRYNGPGNGEDKAVAMAIDNSSNIYVTGYSTSSGTNTDYATIKYNSVGIEQWVARYNGPRDSVDRANKIVVDDSGYVYVTGGSSGLNTRLDYTTIKYNSTGDTIWVRRYNGPGNGNDEAKAIAVDDLGNIYVTGYTYSSTTLGDYTTIKYNSHGDTIWVRNYNGPANYSDMATAIAVDDSGNIYVTGSSYDAYEDYLTIKYNATGVQEWVQRYNGTGNNTDIPTGIAIDNANNIYVTGYSERIPSTNGLFDYATIKYNAAGVQQWVTRYNGPGNNWDKAYAIAVDDSGYVYVTGGSYTATTNADYATIKYRQIMPGVEENRSLLPANHLSLEVYPNPARSYFTIRLPQMLHQVQHDKIAIKIFDVTGKIVKEILRFAQNDKTVRIPLDGIKNGVYFINVGDEPCVAKGYAGGAMVKEKLIVTK